MKDGGKSRGTKEVNRFCYSYYGFHFTQCAKCGHEKVRAQDSVDWQDHREGVGENIADFCIDGIGYVLPGAGARM